MANTNGKHTQWGEEYQIRYAEIENKWLTVCKFRLSENAFGVHR